ncbi:glycolipid transfer protein [Achroia grisella]|uniref:glycolipid transfer protein n=1 Tax=Achroia grisella TaxID=688607 RepID=UPI0027D2503D|nr:glycolipid transfer protein [Achroia grisella]
MACASTKVTKKNVFYDIIKPFPPVINGKINLVKFLESASDLVTLIEHLGKIYAPVKYDMQGNIDKIKKACVFDKTSCLLELMLDEVGRGKTAATESILWLNRALLLFELIFQEIISHLKSNHYDVNMDKIFITAYEGSLKKYHNWVTQQIFALICKMSPTLPQIMKSLDVDDVKSFETKLLNFNITLHLVRCKIDDFFKDHNMFVEVK